MCLLYVVDNVVNHVVDHLVDHVFDYVVDHVVNQQNRSDFFLRWTLTLRSLYVRRGGIFCCDQSVQ